MSATFEHVTVLRKETVAYAVGALEEGMVVDCTLGGGGHTEHLLETYESINVVGLDRDEDALSAATKRLARFGTRFRPVHARFSSLDMSVPAIGVPKMRRVLSTVCSSSSWLSAM